MRGHGVHRLLRGHPAEHRPDGHRGGHRHPGLHRHRRRLRRGHDHAGHGAGDPGHPRVLHRPHRGGGPSLRHGPHLPERHRRHRLLRVREQVGARQGREAPLSGLRCL